MTLLFANDVTLPLIIHRNRLFWRPYLRFSTVHAEST